METQYREQYIRFGLKVQYYRKIQGLTQEAFADKIGKSWSFVAKIESPTQAFGVSMETMFKIAEALVLHRFCLSTCVASVGESCLEKLHKSLYRLTSFCQSVQVPGRSKKLPEKHQVFGAFRSTKSQQAELSNAM